MKPLYLALGVHNHQPVGNFDFVFEYAYQNAYLPFLEALERHPTIRIAQHYSGILLDWIQRQQPEFLSRMRALVERGQLELMTGAFFEPILSIIPDEDKIGQIRKLTQFLRERFGCEPVGLWLAERIWEPHLSRALASAGVRYVVLDDSHFKNAGLRPEELVSHFVTEEQGVAVSLFPISEMLRYTIPYEDPAKVLEYLRDLAVAGSTHLAVFADDGEKFGVWPGSHKHCYEDGWLDRFFEALEANSDWLRLIHFSEALDTLPSAGRIYLPTAAYREMMEWAMPAHAILEYQELERFLLESGRFERYKVFVRGGFWRNFLAKYPESNNMHKKMLHLSRRLSKLRPKFAANKRFRQAETHVWAGQCNCPYWHGVFGGLYLNHLRYANYHELIQAERHLDTLDHGATEDGWIDDQVFDFDVDGHEEVLVSTPTSNYYFSPALGGSLFELDFKPKAINLCDTMTRRPEAYHEKIRAAARAESFGDTETEEPGDWISKQEGLETLLHYDWYRRTSFLDHFLREDTTLEGFAACRYGEQGDFVNQPYGFKVRRQRGRLFLDLWRRGQVWVGEWAVPLQVSKRFRFSANQSELQGAYRIKNLSDRPVELWFGVELDFSLLAGDAADRFYVFPGHNVPDTRLRSSGEIAGVREFSLVDEYLGVNVQIVLGQAAEVWRFPIETVSLSEGGFERVYQSSVVFPNWKIALAADNEWKGTVAVRVTEV